MKYCEEYAALLDAFADGECTPEEAAQVQAHLDSCEGCRAYLDEILLIKNSFPDLKETEVPDGFAESVAAMIRADAAPQKKRRRNWVRLVLPVAACLAVLVMAEKLPMLFSSGSGVLSTASESAASSSFPEEFSESSAGTAETGSEDTATPASGGSENDSTDTTKRSAELPAKSAAPVQKKTSESSSPADEPAPDVTESIAPQRFGMASGTSSNDADSSTPPSDDRSGEVPSDSTDSSEASSLSIAAAPVKTYYKQISVSAQEIGSLLDGYEGVESEDPVTGAPITTYELNEEDFDDIAAQLPDVQVTVTNDAGTDLCCVVVTQ